MTDKKKRARGSRTHGGGSQKNRRGAGNRGGRGNAGSYKHEVHDSPPPGKHGFTRPPETQPTVAEVEVRRLDEDAPLLAADGLAEATDDGYRIDAREVIDAGHDVDVVKVLGNGQVRNRLEVIADDFTEGAIELLEAAGGAAIHAEGDDGHGEGETDAGADDEGGTETNKDDAE